MLRDTEHFKTKIGSLDGAGDAGDYLVNLVKAKNVPKPKVATPPPPPAPIEEKEKDVEKVEAPVANGKSSSDEETNGKGNTAVDELEKAQTSAATA